MKAKELYLKKELTDFDIAVARTFLANLIGERKARNIKLLTLTYVEFEGSRVSLSGENNFKYLELNEDIYIQGICFSKIAFMAGNGDIIISLIDDDFNNVTGINITKALGISQADECVFNREKNHYQEENKTNYSNDSYNENEKEDSYDYYYDNYEKNNSNNKNKNSYDFNGYSYIEENTYNYSDNKARKNKKNKASNYNVKKNYNVNNNNTFSDDSGNFTEEELKKMWEESHENDYSKQKQEINKNNYSEKNKKNDEYDRQINNMMFLGVIAVAILLVIIGANS